MNLPLTRIITTTSILLIGCGNGDIEADDDAPGTGSGVESGPTTGSGDDDSTGSNDSGSDSGSDASSVGSDSGEPLGCGDGVVQGDEICDDGVNDGGYGGCLADCSGLAARCGDGEVQFDADETCDDALLGAGNIGCNAQCRATGELLGSLDIDLPRSGEASISLLTPQFNDSGTALVGLSTFSDPRLFELDDQLQITGSYDESDFPSSNRYVARAGVRGNSWIFSSFTCVVGFQPDLRCLQTHFRGYDALVGHSNGSYYAMENEVVAFFEPDAPIGAEPTWTAGPPDDENAYFTYDTTFDAAGGVVRVGQKNIGGTGGIRRGFIRHTLADGNRTAVVEVPDTVFSSEVEATSDGGLFVLSLVMGADRIDKLNESLEVEWSIPLESPFDSRAMLLVDPYDRPVLVAPQDGALLVTKWSHDGQDELWSQTRPELVQGEFPRNSVSTAPDGTTWISRHRFAPDGGERLLVERLGI